MDNKELSSVSDDVIKSLHEVIGLHVKQLRENSGISQLDMALSIGIKSVAFYSNCENSQQDKHFNIEHLYKICQILKIKLGDFFLDIDQF